MKKIIVTLAVLLLAAPAMGTVFITCVPGPGPNDVTVSFSSSGETELVRALALDVQVSDPNAYVEDVCCVHAEYNIHPTNIVIGVGGAVEDYGSCAGVLDANLVISEQGSLYVGAANEPAEGDLFIVTIGGCSVEDPNEVTVTVSENALRGGVVMEDANGPSGGVNLTGASATWLIGECAVPCPCRGDIGGPGGLVPDGTINIIDLSIIVGTMINAYPTGDPLGLFDIGLTYPCADIGGPGGLVPDGTVNIIDMSIIVGTMINVWPTGDPMGLFDIDCPF